MSERIAQQIEHIVHWLRKQVAAAGAKGLVVGVSGGIDSAVVACLIKRAFPDNSLGIILPCKSNPEDKEMAEKVIQAAGINSMEVNLSDIHSALLEQVKDQVTIFAPAEKDTKVAQGNLKARLRMCTLYYIANSLNYLVAGTDNAAELHTGYFTKFGDGGVDLIPIANLTKREVRAMGAFLGVPDIVVNRVPTAGLWEQQTDESEMGTSYEMIDDYLEGKVIPDADRKLIEAMHQRSAHKRLLPPAPPKI